MAKPTATNHQSPIIVVMFLLLMTWAPPWTAEAQFIPGPPPPSDLEASPPRVDLKMAIVMVLLVTVFFILGFLSVYTRQCAQERFRARFEMGFAAGGGPTHGWGSRGLDADVMETLPTFVYSSVKGVKIGKGSLECAVCLSEFEDSETLRLIPKCDHVFHQDCIDAWLVSHSTCPVCRANLVPKPGETHLSPLPEYLNPVVRPEADVVPDEPATNRAGLRVMREEDLPVSKPADEVNESQPPRSRSVGFRPGRVGSTGWVLGALFPRSRSTGNLLVRHGESMERYTLRLPDDVRSHLVATSVALNRARSAGAGVGALPRVGSSRRGFRSGSVRRKDGMLYERFEQEASKPDGRRVFSLVLPFVSRSGSVGSSKGSGSERHKSGSASDYVGERSTDPLRPDDQV